MMPDEETALYNITPVFCNVSSEFGNLESNGFCNHSLEEFESHQEHEINNLERYISIVVPIFFAIIVTVGLFGNALVVIVVLFNAQMRSTTNLLIINLAVADLLFIVLCVPFTATDYAFTYWLFGEICCRSVQYLIHACAYASIYTLVLMSLDRFLAVVHPITSISIRTESNAYWAIAFTWLAVLVLCVPAFFAFSTYPVPRQHGIYRDICTFDSSKFNHKIFQMCFFFSSYILPLALILVLYVLMLRRLWWGVTPGGQISSESRRCKKRVTRLVVVVVLIFAACWMPIQVVLVLKSLNLYPMTDEKVVLQIIAQVLAYTNSCVNPILYAFLSENFRRAFRKIVACGKFGTEPMRPEEAERTAFESTVNTNIKMTTLTNGNA